jgi:hypothetical protein
MITLISFSLVTLAALLALPVAVFLAEVVAAITLPQRDRLVPPRRDASLRVAVVVPAHNESVNLLFDFFSHSASRFEPFSTGAILLGVCSAAISAEGERPATGVTIFLLRYPWSPSSRVEKGAQACPRKLQDEALTCDSVALTSKLIAH